MRGGKKTRCKWQYAMLWLKSPTLYFYFYNLLQDHTSLNNKDTPHWQWHVCHKVQQVSTIKWILPVQASGGLLQWLINWASYLQSFSNVHHSNTSTLLPTAHNSFHFVPLKPSMMMAIHFTKKKNLIWPFVVQVPISFLVFF